MRGARAWALAGAVALAGATGAGAAELDCVFATECLEGEDCIESGYALRVAPMAPPADADARTRTMAALMATVEDDTGEVIVSAWTGLLAGARGWSWESAAGFHLLSLAPDGTARYAVHMPRAETAIRYLGRCEETG